MFDVVEIKNRLNIFDVADRLGLRLQGKGNLYRSPFRDDKKPSFSISKDGQLFNDFATGDKGDLVEFYKLATNTDTAQAIKDLASITHVAETPYKAVYTAKHINTPIKSSNAQERPNIPHLTWNKSHATQLQSLRGYSIESQRIAYERKIFGFCEYFNSPAWIVKDVAGNVAQARKVNGQLWKWADREIKSITLKNSDCSTPAGFYSIESGKHIILCEGSTDLLAVFHFAWLNDCLNDLVPLAMLGANQHINKDCLDVFSDKKVLIFPDCDDAGSKALKTWSEQIELYADKVFYFDFKGFHTATGDPVKDLSDFMRLDYDEWEQGRPYTENPFFELFNNQ